MPLLKLTARFVETARFAERPPRTSRPRKTAKQSHRTEIRDTDVRGLELRIERDRAGPDGKMIGGAKKWAFRYRRQSDGRKRTVTLGAFPTYSLEKARAWAQELKSAIAGGADPAGERRARRAAETFG